MFSSMIPLAWSVPGSHYGPASVVSAVFMCKCIHYFSIRSGSIPSTFKIGNSTPSCLWRCASTLYWHTMSKTNTTSLTIIITLNLLCGRRDIEAMTWCRLLCMCHYLCMVSCDGYAVVNRQPFWIIVRLFGSCPRWHIFTAVSVDYC